MKTQVGIIGAGPAGLFLSHLLKQHGIESVILEAHDRAYVEGRVRAGVLEAGTVSTLENLGLATRMHRESMEDKGLDMRFRSRVIHLDLPALTGKSVRIYGQQEVIKDLIKARLASGDPIIFEAEAVRIDGLDSDTPRIRYKQNGIEKTLDCLFIAGCDGFHGIARTSVPDGVIQTYVRNYDFAWLGILAHAAPLADMTYTNHDRGFALCSRRSPKISRLYLQVPLSDTQEMWPDTRFWDELHVRMFDTDRSDIQEGEIFQRDVARLRAYIAQPMQYGPLFLAGDAAHIVPPTGAKGLNMAVADVRVLARALAAFFASGSRTDLNRYSQDCGQRIWKTIRYSVYITGLLHRFAEHTDFERGIQLAELEHIASSQAAQQIIAEQYVNLSHVSD